MNPPDFICKNYNLIMSLTKNVDYMDDWQDVKEANKKVVDAAAAFAKENHVTQSDVDKKIAEAIASSGPGGGISENKVNEKITKAINQYKSSDKDYYIKSVSVSNGKLVLTYNEGKNPVSVDLSSFGFASSADLAGKQDKLTDAQIDALADLSNFVTMSALNDYCKKTEVDSKISTEIAKVVANADADFDTLKEIADWIKNDTTGASKMSADIDEIKNQVKDFLSKTEADDLYQAKGEYLTSSALNGYAKSADVDSTYVKKSELADYATETEVNTIINGKNFLTENSLTDYAKTADVANAYQPKGEYLTSESLSDYTKTSDIEKTYATKKEIDSLVTETELEEKGYLTETALNGFATETSIAENYQPKGSYLTQSDLTDYAKTADIENAYQPKGEYLTSESLNGYATTDSVNTALEGYVPNTSIAEYAKKEELNSYATTESVNTALAEYTKTTVIADTYQQKLSNEQLAVLSTDMSEFVKTVNGQTPDENGNVSIDVPEKVSELTNDTNFTSVEEVNRMMSKLLTRIEILEKQQTNLAVASTPEEISAISTQDALNTNLVLTSSEAVESMTSKEKTFQSIAVVGGAVDSTVMLNATDSVIVDGIEISGDKDNNNNGKINYKSPELVVKNISIKDGTATVYNMFEGSQEPNNASTLNKVVTFSNIYIDDVKLTHNIINVYTPAEGAVITVKDSYFNLDPENSNVMRIANYANSKNITINFENVEWTYENAGKTEDTNFRYAGLLLYQPANTDAMLESPANAEALKTMRINFKNCKYNGELVSSVNLGQHNQVAYLYNAGNAKQIEDINNYANDDEPIITFSE